MRKDSSYVGGFTWKRGDLVQLKTLEDPAENYKPLQGLICEVVNSIIHPAKVEGNPKITHKKGYRLVDAVTREPINLCGGDKPTILGEKWFSRIDQEGMKNLLDEKESKERVDKNKEYLISSPKTFEDLIEICSREWTEEEEIAYFELEDAL